MTRSRKEPLGKICDRKPFTAWYVLREFPEEVFSCYGDGYARLPDRYDCGYAHVLLYGYVSFHYVYA